MMRRLLLTLLSLSLPVLVQAQSVALVHSEIMRMTADPDVTAVASGDFDEPAVWGGMLPPANSRLHIPAGLTVIVDSYIATRYEWIAHDGTLSCAGDGRLVVGTLVSHGPLNVSDRCRIVFRSNGQPFDHKADPLELMRGLIAMSPVTIQGAAKQEICAINGFPDVGATSLMLECDPTGWAIGDELLIAPTLWGQDEVVKVEKIDGRAIGFSPPLKFTRTNHPNDPAIRVHVGNLTRSIVIESDAPDKGDRARQGHVMLMGGGHQIRNAAFLDTGRTVVFFADEPIQGGQFRKAPVTDPILVDGVRDPQLMPTCRVDRENVRGRYALHFHNPGPASPESVVEGVVIRVQRHKGFKIGIQNHSAFVSVRRVITHQMDGSHLFAEEGDERGEYVDALTVHSLGSNADRTNLPTNDQECSNEYPEIWARRRDDAGHRGAGYWPQGSGNVRVENLVCAGHAHACIDHSAEGLNQNHPNTFRVLVRPDHLRNTDDSWYREMLKRNNALAGYDPSMPRLEISRPVFVARNIHAYAIGPSAAFNQRGARKVVVAAVYGLQMDRFAPRPKNLVQGVVCWNIPAVVDTSYSDWGRWEDITCYQGALPPNTTQANDALTRRAINTRSQNGRFHEYVDIRLNGWSDAVAMNPSEGSTFSNVLVNNKPYVPTIEACGDGVDNDGNAAIDEGCLTPVVITPLPDTDPPELTATTIAKSLLYEITVKAQDLYQGQPVPGTVLVDIFLDGDLLIERCTAPCTQSFDLATYKPGPHVLAAFGVDTVGNRTPEPFRVTVIR